MMRKVNSRERVDDVAIQSYSSIQPALFWMLLTAEVRNEIRDQN